MKKKTGKIVNCDYCDNEIYKMKYEIKRNENLFCSLDCSSKFNYKIRIENDKNKWDEIQKWYDEEDKFLKDITEKYNVSDRQIRNAKKFGIFKTRSLSENRKLMKPHKHSEETKNKLSVIRIEYLKKNPDKIPYLLNHSSKESYPEKYFNEVFENRGLNLERYYQIGLYQLDFSIPDQKIDIEIDGNQHYTDKKVIEIDKRRNLFLENKGWKILRVKWAEFKKLDFEQKQEYIDSLIKEMHQ